MDLRRLKLALIGAGQRGAHCYAPYALKYPREVFFDAVAEPDSQRRNSFGDAHAIPAEKRFAGWQELLSAGLELDGVIVATQDNEHYEPVVMALEKGYNVLCEKPMAETLEKSRAMVKASEDTKLLLMVCHVLRYTPFFSEIKKVIDSGKIGEIKTIHHLENIGNWHFAHSFVRGNWANSAKSTPMIVAKCSHDMDILNFLLGKSCRKLTSFGSLSYFTPGNKPEGAALMCSSCDHNKACNFSSYNYYEEKDAYTPFRDILENIDGRLLENFLENGPYDRCVYACDNDVSDHQTVMMEYDGGVTVAFTASAFSADISRHIKIMGTKGELEGCLEDDFFYMREFGSGTEIKYSIQTPKTLHSGGDERIMAHFCSALRNPAAHQELSAGFSLAGHEMAFAAEASRLSGGSVVQLDSF